MSNKQEIKELSVYELFQEGRYNIPIYQRNYAWGETEVEQLLQDIFDVATNDQPMENYYIGSLVVNRRKDSIFEIIDGQQRHTTLSIILSVIKNEYKQDLTGIKRVNLDFDSRPKSASTLYKLFSNPDRNRDEPEERSMRAAYDISSRFLAKNEAKIKQLTTFLLHKVKILRVIVPKDTDLNHYFEIMNNRGEQLEKHEVLKARLMSQLANDSECSAFDKIWNACADMNRYMQLGFEAEDRTKIFGSDWNTCPQTFDEICQNLSNPHPPKKQQTLASSPHQPKKQQTLASIIANPQLKEGKKLRQSEDDLATFNSVINFSNFLLHVLRVDLLHAHSIDKDNDIPLDDKRLLDIFNKYKPEPDQFIMALLKCRILFDRFIIKRENDEDWSMKSLKVYDDGFGYVNSAKDEKQNQQLVMLQAMFHVSFPALVYKHWLSAALWFLYKNASKQEIKFMGMYTERLEKMSNRFLYGLFGVYNNNSSANFFEICFEQNADKKLPKKLDKAQLNQGTKVQNFIFNRLDYQLWKRLTGGEKFANVNMAYILKRFKKFRFTFRTSVEHYYPQHPFGGKPLSKSSILKAGCDTFGNLCLISHSSNSKLSNYLPTAKKEHYEKSSSVESLKQTFMMSYPNWGPEDPQIIADHENMMINILEEKDVRS